jgi:endonuclease G, mitochondrial
MELSTLIVLLLAALSILFYMVITDRKKAKTAPKKAASAASVPSKTEEKSLPTTDEGARRSAELATRLGYDPNFVATKTDKIDLGDVLKNHVGQLTPLTKPEGANKFILHYHHFSVAMNRERKMPLLTAVNIDGKQTREIGRDTDKWFYDPRMDKKDQLGKEIYVDNELDLGHLVRRLDPVWGADAALANADTFHFTVCAPQHAKLNRVTWKSLEDYILKNTQAEDLKVSVFTGPVFSDQDVPFRGVLLPLQFWKMAALVKNDGKMSVSAYILSHKEYLDEVVQHGFIGDTGFEEYKTYQIPLRRLQELTNLNLEHLFPFDPLHLRGLLAGPEFVEIGEAEDVSL